MASSEGMMLGTVATGTNEGPMGLNRREFMTYAWGAALALLTAETVGATYFFLTPRFRAGEFGGKFALGATETLPVAEEAPHPNSAGKFWLVNTKAGPKAIYMVCTHLGCLYKWSEQEGRFMCPCHGSQFSREGDYICGPAPRSLDQFTIELVANHEVVATTTEATDRIHPPRLPATSAEVVVHTGQRLLGRSKELSPALGIQCR